MNCTESRLGDGSRCWRSGNRGLSPVVVRRESSSRRRLGCLESRHPRESGDPWTTLTRRRPVCRRRGSPGKAGDRSFIYSLRHLRAWVLCLTPQPWLPAFAGMTGLCGDDERHGDDERKLQSTALLDDTCKGGQRSSNPRPWFPAFGGMTPSSSLTRVVRVLRV
jgi:hypothetical protein